MKRTLLTFISLIAILSLSAQNHVLKFNDKGRFKIVQFTDVHYQKDTLASQVAIDLIKEVLDKEKPNLVVFTGDIVTSRPAKEGLDEVFAQVIKQKTPWTYVFGNHDDEHGVSRQELMEHVMQKPYCMVQAGDKALEGVGNYIIEVKSSTNDQVGALLYHFDSGAYSPLKGVGTYDWFGFNQVDWYRAQSAAYTYENGGDPLPALAFFHIPLAEYATMKAEKYDQLIGSKDEKECNGVLNTGMFAAMRMAGDVMGTFVGHDHNNDYIGNYHGIYLAYGRFSGGKTTYTDLGLNGCRVIELEEGKHEFSTYIRLRGGETLYPVHYPTTFAPKKK